VGRYSAAPSPEGVQEGARPKNRVAEQRMNKGKKTPGKKWTEFSKKRIKEWLGFSPKGGAVTPSFKVLRGA